MKRLAGILIALAVAACQQAPAPVVAPEPGPHMLGAGVPISGLPAGTPPYAATDIVAAVQSNTTVKAQMGDMASTLTSKPSTWNAAQRGKPFNIAIVGNSFTPNFDNNQNFEIDLTSACPCTLANPNTGLVAGQTGMFEVHQDTGGSRTITTWGSDYQFAGGTSTITLASAANAITYVPYYVNNAATAIVLGGTISGPVH